MKPRRLLFIVAALLTLLVVLFLGANYWVGGGNSATVADVACARCIQDGFPAKNMMVLEVDVQDPNMFGFGGRAMVEIRVRSFTPDALLLRVELRRRMNLMNWEVLTVSKEP